MEDGGVLLQYVFMIFLFISFTYLIQIFSIHKTEVINFLLFFTNSLRINYYKYKIQLFKLCRLLHKRIDPAVEILRKKPQSIKTKRAENFKTTTDELPVGAPNWCLNQEALKRFNRPTNNIPVYDYDTEKSQEYDNGNHNDIEDDNEETNSNKRKRKTKKKKPKKKRREKQHKSKRLT
jgi:hypothetical protein